METRKWLNSKVRDDTIKDIYEINEYTLSPYEGYFDDINYYSPNDDDLQNNAICCLENNEYLIDYVDSFKDIDILIPPNTNRFHCNTLFKQLVDYSIFNNYEYDIYDDLINELRNYPLIYPEFKEEFYKFCFENTNIC